MADRLLPRHQELVARICPILGGQPYEVQGSVLAELLAIWLGGFPASYREQLLANHIASARELLPHVEVNRSAGDVVPVPEARH